VSRVDVAISKEAVELESVDTARVEDAGSEDAVSTARVELESTCANTGFASTKAATAKRPMRALRPNRWPKVSFMRSLYYLDIGSHSLTWG
jgi:hypothetical protein